MEHCHLGLKKLRLIIINASKWANSIWAQCILSWINYSLMIVHFTFATGLPYSAIFFFFFLKLNRCVEPALSWHRMFPSGSNHLGMFFFFSPPVRCKEFKGVVLLLWEWIFHVFEAGWKTHAGAMWSNPLRPSGDQRDFVPRMASLLFGFGTHWLVRKFLSLWHK